MTAAERSWPGLLSALMAGDSLSAEDTAWAMNEIMAGDASPARLAALVVLLRAKGETPDELAGFVHTMRERATPLHVPVRAVDIVVHTSVVGSDIPAPCRCLGERTSP